MSELLLGCGHSRQRRMFLPNTGKFPPWENLITLDSNANCVPNILCDLDDIVWRPRFSVESTNFGCDVGMWGSILKESFFAEVHAYEVLEHLGRQGDVESFFATFDNIYRILIPDGYLFATVPSRFSPWLWGDPGHRRVILPESLHFLDQTHYAQVGHTMMSDYRNIYHSDFKIISSTDDKVLHSFILQAIKPARKI